MEKNDDWLIGKLTIFQHNHDYDWIMDRVKEWAAAREVARAAALRAARAAWNAAKIARDAALDAEYAAKIAREKEDAALATWKAAWKKARTINRKTADE